MKKLLAALTAVLLGAGLSCTASAETTGQSEQDLSAFYNALTAAITAHHADDIAQAILFPDGHVDVDYDDPYQAMINGLVYEIAAEYDIDAAQIGLYYRAIARVKKGDAVPDCAITPEDAQTVLQKYTKLLSLDEPDFSTGQYLYGTDLDINGDGLVTAEDAQFILAYYTANTVAGVHTDWDALLAG